MVQKMMMTNKKTEMEMKILTCLNILLMTCATALASTPDTIWPSTAFQSNWEPTASGLRSGDSTLEISSLGRPLDVGTLYNARNDQIEMGIRPWKSEDILGNTQVFPQPTTHFQVTASTSLSEKIRLLDMSASIKASFLGGLIEVGGSAKYLNQKTSSNQQCSFSLRYHEVTHYKQLLMSQLPMPSPVIFNMTDATHVVVGVIYGADAIMEFQQTAKDQKDKQEIEGNLNVMIKKIPSIEISGNGSLNMNDEEKEKVKKFSCTFNGDFHLDELPSTFEEAVKVYKTLPSLLGENGEKAVPLKVWLYPLSKLVDIDSKLKNVIAETLVSQVEVVIDDLHHAKIRANDLLERSNGVKANGISNKLEQFQKSLNIFTSEFLVKISKFIPGIRGGEMNETALADLLKSQDASGFSKREMQQWLDGKEIELSIISRTINELNSQEIIPPGPEFDAFLLDPDINEAFVFSFTSLDYEEPYLKTISHSAESFNSNLTQSIKVPWYRNPAVWKTTRYSIFVFNECKQRKIISYISDTTNPIAAIRKYQEGDLVDQNVQAKDIPFFLYAFDLTLDPDTANSKLTLSEKNKQVSNLQETNPYPPHPKRFTMYPQVLSKEALVGRRLYWEIRWGGYFVGPYLPIGAAVTYKSISRDDEESKFGGTDKSWCLYLHKWYFYAVHNDIEEKLDRFQTFQVGIFLDKDEGTLSFYSLIGDTPKHLYTYKNIKFTDEPLYAGIYAEPPSRLYLSYI